MKHFGDITQLSGYDLPTCDVLVGGSPCQDLSVAGKRQGLAGERSGLFMEQIRIVKEMREKDGCSGRSAVFRRCRFMVWENVPGCTSSGSPRGSDFQAVLQEVARVVCKEAPPIPIPKEGWPRAGCLHGVGDDGTPFSIAYKQHDAQWWGVPQRRKRVSLLADFNGLSAGEILFDPQYWGETTGAESDEAVGDPGRDAGCEVLPVEPCVSRDPESCGEERKGTSGDAP